VKPAVMSPQRDITNEIRADIARRTQGPVKKRLQLTA
jgi:conjugal transfer pilin signal peptidase TrbI